MPKKHHNLDIKKWKAKLDKYEARRRLMGDQKWCEYMAEKYGDRDDQVLLRTKFFMHYSHVTITGQIENNIGRELWRSLQKDYLKHHRDTQRYNYYKVPLWLVPTMLKVYSAQPTAVVHPNSICQSIVSNNVEKPSKKG